jgi:hypothetical protein
MKKRIIPIIILCGMLLFSACGGTETTDTTDIEETPETVYIGKTGTKYHYEDCPTLKGKGSPITYDEAIEQGREPCKVCR